MVNIAKPKFISGAIWTTAGFGISQLLRLGTNVILTRLLAPEIFGIINVVRSIVVGVELTSDIGLSQNIVQSSRGLETGLLNTAWTLQIIRGVLLFAILILVTPLVSKIYHEPVFSSILPIIAIGFIFSGFTSTSISVLQKTFQYSRRVRFDVIVDFISALTFITLAFLYPNIWSMVFGLIAGNFIRTICSHLLFEGTRNRIQISLEHLREIVSFGKWMFASSGVYFMTMHFDLLYLGTRVPFALLGIYGIARGLAETMYVLATRLTGLLVFPYISASQNMPRSQLRKTVGPSRFAFVFTTAMVIAMAIGTSDLIVRILYDERYHASIWMLHILFAATWIRIVNELNGSVLLGIGKPVYVASANMLKLVTMLVGIPLAFNSGGLSGALVAVVCSELCSYFALYVSLRREKLSFCIQDALATLLLIVLIVTIELVRYSFGYETSFASVWF